MDDFKEFILDQIETIDEHNISRPKLEEVFRFIVDYAEDNYLI